MIRSSATLKLGAVVLALAVHGLAAISFIDRTEVLIESDAGAQTAALGSSFADMVEGTLAPKVTEQEVFPDPVTEKATTEPPTKTKAETPNKVEVAQPVTTTLTPSKTKVTQSVTATLTPTATQATKPITASNNSPLTPAKSASVISANLPVRSEPVQDVKPASEAPKAETLQAIENKNASAVTRSVRPQKRSAELEKRAAAAKPKPVKRAKSGNAQRNAKAGSSSGSKTSSRKKQGQGQSRKKRAGNAAASNYPGRVMARISSVGRPRVNARGTARVRFSIGSNGALRSAGVTRSSGSRRLDRAAVNIIHNASPFPRPPAGAQRTFSINITGQ